MLINLLCYLYTRCCLVQQQNNSLGYQVVQVVLDFLTVHQYLMLLALQQSLLHLCLPSVLVLQELQECHEDLELPVNNHVHIDKHK